MIAIRHRAEIHIMTYEFVGHITQFHEGFDLLYVRLSRVLPF